MSERELLRQFELGSIPRDRFHHRDHVRVGWLILRQHPLLPALAKYSEGLKTLTRAHSVPGKYHETITWAYLSLIHERMKRAGDDQPWREFERRNDDLMDWDNPILGTYYREETLKSDVARKSFVFPDNFS